MIKPEWWHGMLELRSFKTVVKLFKKHVRHNKDFFAVVETADEYKHANTNRVRQMLESCGILKLEDEKIVCDLDRLDEAIEVIDEQD